LPCRLEKGVVMNNFTAEAIGTGLLILFGDGVVAGVVLNKTKSQNSGWIVITFGWGLAVAIAVYAVARFSGAHINPAVTLALATTDQGTAWKDVPTYIAGQYTGAIIGAVLVYLAYYPHWAPTEDPGTKLAVFCTGPAIRNYVANFITEVIGTAALLIGVLAITANDLTVGFAPLLIGLLVLAIGLSLGGPTGYAINPARDLGPRIAHFLLPIPGKRDSDWSYAWIPVVAPIVGGILGAWFYKGLFT
jgi:glycerol uptake facilitator protein